MDQHHPQRGVCNTQTNEDQMNPHRCHDAGHDDRNQEQPFDQPFAWKVMQRQRPRSRQPYPHRKQRNRKTNAKAGEQRFPHPRGVGKNILPRVQPPLARQQLGKIPPKCKGPDDLDQQRQPDNHPDPPHQAAAPKGTHLPPDACRAYRTSLRYATSQRIEKRVSRTPIAMAPGRRLRSGSR